MEKRLGRRITLFARTITAVWLLAAVAWLQKLDSHDLRQDVHDLRLLGQVGQIEPAETLKRLPGRAFDNTIDWVAERHPDVSEGRASVRRHVVDLLLENGAPRSLIGEFSGKTSAPLHGAVRFHFLNVLDLVPKPAEADAVNKIALSTSASSEERRAAAGWLNPDGRPLLMTVSHVLDELDQLARPREIVCAIDVEDEELAAVDFGRPASRRRRFVIRPKDAASDTVSQQPASPDDRDPVPVTIEFGGPAPGIDAGSHRFADEDGPGVEPRGAHVPPNAGRSVETSINGPGVPRSRQTSDIPGADLLLGEDTRTANAENKNIAVDSWRDYRGVTTSQPRVNRQRHWLYVQSAELQDGTIHLDYKWADDENGNSHDHDQDGDPDVHFGTHLPTIAQIPVQTTRLAGPSLLELSDPERSANGPLLRLAGSSERVAYIRRAYGHLPLDHAGSLASEGLAQAYRNLSLFGFQFSTRRFPLAVLVLLGVALWQTLTALHSGRRLKLNVFGQIAEDSALEMLVSNRLLRLLLWIALPLSAVWASLPLVPLPASEQTWVLIGSIALACLGAGCAWMAEQQGQPAAAQRRQ